METSRGEAMEGGALPHIGRLLEEGNGDELRRWVAEWSDPSAARATPGIDAGTSVGERASTADAEAVLAAWLAERGGRELSHRSRAFWELVFATPAGRVPPLAGALWPLSSPGS